MKAQEKNVVKSQERKVNAIIILGIILLSGLAAIAFRPINYTEAQSIKKEVKVSATENLITLYLPSEWQLL